MGKDLKPVTFDKFIATARNGYLKIGFDIFSGRALFFSILFWNSAANQIFTIPTYVLYIRESFQTGENVLKAVACFLFMITQTSTVIKMIVIYTNRKMISSIFKRLKERFPTTSEEQIKCGLRKYLGNLKLLRYWSYYSLSFLLALAIIPVLVIIYVYFTKGVFLHLMPVEVRYPFSTDSHIVFVCCYIFQTITGIQNTYGFIFFDIIIETMMILVCVKLDVLREEIKKLYNDPPSKTYWKTGVVKVIEVQPSIKKVDFTQQIKFVVMRHQEIIELVSDINDVFSPTILYTILNDTAILCFNLFTSLVSIEE